MNRSIVLLPGLFIIAMLFACTQEASPPLLFQSGHVTPLACNFLSKIQVLQQNYDPNSNSYSPPTDPNNIQQNYSLRDEIKNDLTNAYANAPPNVQMDLCALTAVFIDSSF